MFTIISWGYREIFLVFSVNFMASKDKNLREKKHQKIHGTKKSDTAHSAITVLKQVSYGYEN